VESRVGEKSTEMDPVHRLTESDGWVSDIECNDIEDCACFSSSKEVKAIEAITAGGIAVGGKMSSRSMLLQRDI